MSVKIFDGRQGRECDGREVMHGDRDAADVTLTADGCAEVCFAGNEGRTGSRASDMNEYKGLPR